MQDNSKIEEFLEIANNDLSVLEYTKECRFPDGRLIYNFYCYHKKDILLFIQNEECIKKYPVACQFILKSARKSIDKIYEFIEWVNSHGYIPQEREKIFFKDGTSFSGYWYCNKEKIFKLIQLEENMYKYDVAYKLMIKRYYIDIEKLERKNRRRIKFVCVFNNIDIEKNKDIIDTITLDDFTRKLEYLKINDIPFIDDDGVMNPIFSTDITSLIAKDSKGWQKKK